MRPEVVAAERAAMVRAAAKTWRKAGWITEPAEAAIRQRYADDRQRQGPALRTLLFVLTWFAVWSGFGTLSALFELFDEPAPVLLVLGVGCIAMAEVAYDRFKLLDFGPESALAWCGVGFVLAGCGFAIDKLSLGDKLNLLTLLGLGAILFGLGAWRWGSWLMALLAGGSLLGIFAGLPLGRLSWIVAGLAGAFLALRAAESGDFGPSHRRCCRALLVLSLAAVALALFPDSNEEGWVEKLGLRREDASPIPLLFAWLASVAFAAGLLRLGLRTRRRLLLDAAVLLGAAIVAAACRELFENPYWVTLSATGLVLIGGALAIRRFLDAGDHHERAGFTAAPLLEDPESRALLEAATVMATASPEARDLPKAEAPGFQGKGGGFGGGGASADF